MTALRRLNHTSWEEEFMDLFEDVARFRVHLKNEELRTSSTIYLDYGFCRNFIGPFMFRLLRARPAAEDNSMIAVYQEATRSRFAAIPERHQMSV
jgi:hypothetical protein